MGFSKFFRDVVLSLFLIVPGLALAVPTTDVLPCGSSVRELAETRGIEPLLKQVEEKLANSPVQTATHFDMLEDQKRAELWRGIEGHRLVQSALPDGARFIDHQVVGADRGLVKIDGGNGTFLRAKIGDSGSNVLVLNSALEDNLKRDQKTFVRKDAKAVILFLHGGGTRTTGAHVALGMQGHMHDYGVDVIGMDGAWHAEGDRKFRRNPKDYFENVVRPFIEKYIAASGVPVILAGHSWGGELADNYMRLYPNDDLVSGIISLSTVVDPAPGKNFREKIAAAKEQEERVMQEGSGISQDDRALLDGMFYANKISLPGGHFEGIFSTQNEWQIPEDKGATYIPSLYVWGKADWLYVGNEALINNHIAALKNATVKLYGKRWDFGYRAITDIGHLIFDHKRPTPKAEELFARAEAEKAKIHEVVDSIDADLDRVKDELRQSIYSFSLYRILSQIDKKTSLDAERNLDLTKQSFWEDFLPEQQALLRRYQGILLERAKVTAKLDEILSELDRELENQPIEAFGDVKEFVEGIVGAELKKPKKKGGAGDGLYRHMLQAYANNLAFREFIDSYVFFDRKATSKIGELNKVISGIDRYLKAVKEIEEKIDDPTERKTQIDALESPVDFYGNTLSREEAPKELDRLMSLRSGSYVPDSNEGFKGRNWAREADQLSDLRREKLNEEKDERERLAELDAELGFLEKEIDDEISDLDSAHIRSLKAEIESRRKHVESIYYRFEIKSREHSLKVLEHEGEIDDESLAPGPRFMEIFHDFEEAMVGYQQIKNSVVDHALANGFEGNYGEKLKTLIEMKSRLEHERFQTVMGLREIEATVLYIDERTRELAVMWAEEYSEGVFEAMRTPFSDVFDSSVKEADKQHKKIIQKVWGIWRGQYWNKREAEESTDLY